MGYRGFCLTDKTAIIHRFEWGDEGPCDTVKVDGEMMSAIEAVARLASIANKRTSLRLNPWSPIDWEAEAKRERERREALTRDLESVGRMLYKFEYVGIGICPICGSDRGDPNNTPCGAPHKDGCKMAAALRLVDLAVSDRCAL